MQTLNFDYVKIHPKAVTPEKTPGNLGFDLSVVADENFFRWYEPGHPRERRYTLHPGQHKIFHTGLKIAIQSGYGVVFWDRSGLSIVQGLTMLGGCIDCTYRGEWLVCIKNVSQSNYTISEGDRIIQCITLPEFIINFHEQKSLDDTPRGESGFGASGK
jgi:dUTP pyrophosphatase